MGNSLRKEFELSAVEEDACAVVFKSSESPGLGLDGLDAAVEAFAFGVGDPMTEVTQESLQMTLEHLGGFDDRLQLTARSPTKPAIEELLCVAGVAIFPEPAKLLLDRPGAGGFEFLILERFKVWKSIFGYVLGIVEP